MLLVCDLTRQVNELAESPLERLKPTTSMQAPFTRWTTATGDNTDAHAPGLSGSVMQMWIFPSIQSPQMFFLSVVSQQPVKKTKTAILWWLSEVIEWGVGKLTEWGSVTESWHLWAFSSAVWRVRSGLCRQRCSFQEKNCKYATLTEAKSAKPTGQSLDVLLDSVVTKESLLSAVWQPLWSSSDAAELSAPTGEGRHSHKDLISKSTQQQPLAPWENNLTL